MSVTVQWRGDEVKARIAQAATAGAIAAGRLYHSELRRVVSKPGRPDTTAPPGQPPESDDGGYAASIELNIAQAQGPTPRVTIESPGELPRIFEFGTLKRPARPHWRPTYARLRGAMLERAAAAMRQVMGGGR